MDVSAQTQEAMQNCVESQQKEITRLRRQLMESWDYAQRLELELLAIVRASTLHGSAAPVVADLTTQLEEMRDVARRAASAAAKAKLDLEQHRRDVETFCKTFTRHRAC